MKYMRFFSAILVFILVYVLLGFSTPVAAADVAVSIDVPAAPQPQSSDFIARVNIDSVTDFDGGNYDVTYNPAVIEVTSVTDGDIDGTIIPVSSWGFYPPDPGAQGTIRVINNVPGHPGVTGSGYLAEINFHVVGAASTSSTISISNSILGDKDAQQIPATWTGGTVQVAANSSPPVSIPPDSGGGGGGGGGGGSGGSNGKMTTGLRGISSQEGEVWENVEAPSFDGKMWLDIPYGTMVKNRNGYALTSIIITTIAEPNTPQTDSEIIGGVYELSPSGVTFDPPVTLTVKYDASLIPEGISEDSLFIAYWDENKMEWVPVNSTVNEEEDTITILISHFSTYAILVKTLPASFVLSDLSVVPSEMRPADKAVITVKVANAGDLKGSYEVVLLVNDIALETRLVTLAGRTNQEVNFTYTPVEAGSYSIAIGSLTGLLKAVAPVTETEPEAASAPTLLPEPTPTPPASTEEAAPGQTAPTVYTLTISMQPAEGGSVEPAPGNYTQDADREVSITATAEDGWKFVEWSGSVSDTKATIIFTMDADKTVTANFQKTGGIFINWLLIIGAIIAGLAVLATPSVFILARKRKVAINGRYASVSRR